MAHRVFLDANVLLDFLLKRDSYSSVREIVELAVESKITAFITPAIVHIVAYWLKKAYGAQKTRELMLSLLTDIRVVDISHETTLMAVNSKIDDIEDALQYYTALANSIHYFISSDKVLQRSAIPALPVVSPTQFLRIVSGH